MPKSAQREVIARLHDSHQETDRTKIRARQNVSLHTANHVSFVELIQIFILLVEKRKVDLLLKITEQVEQGRIRYVDAFLEHVYVTFLVEGKLYVNSLQKGNHIPIVVPDEKVSQSRRTFLKPRLLATGVILVENTLVLQSTEEGLFRWKVGVVEPSQTLHVLEKEMTFRDPASVRFQILIVAETRGYVVGHVYEFQLILRQTLQRVVAVDDEKGPDTIFLFFLFVFSFFFLCL